MMRPGGAHRRCVPPRPSDELIMVLAWVVALSVIPYSLLHSSITYWLLIITGMTWQFLVILAFVYRKLGTLHWSAIHQRIWLKRSVNRKTINLLIGEKT